MRHAINYIVTMLFNIVVIFQVKMLNATGISGNSANKLHIYLLFNRFRSELAWIY